LITPSAVAVLPGDRHDRILVKRFLAYLEATRRQRWTSLDYPQERISSRDAVQLIAMEETGRTTAIEHVPMAGSDDGGRDRARWLEAFAPVARDPALTVPAFQIDVAVSVHLAKVALDPKLVIPALRAWCARHLTTVPEGRSPHVIMVAGAPLQLHVEKTPCPGEPGRLLVLHTDLPRQFETIVQQQLQLRLRRVVSASADRHLLLFENSDGQWSANQLRIELGASADFPDLERLDEIWMVDSTRWSENALGFRLIENQSASA
jgi:hypothetical protein